MIIRNLINGAANIANTSGCSLATLFGVISPKIKTIIAESATPQEAQTRMEQELKIKMMSLRNESADENSFELGADFALMWLGI